MPVYKYYPMIEDGVGEVPTALSDLTNDMGFVTASEASLNAPVQSVNGQTGDVSMAIPAAQVASDWNASSGVTHILNKPTSFTPSAHTHAISDISGLKIILDSKTTIAEASAAAPVQSVNGQTGNVSLNIPAQIQSDWGQTNTTSADYIKNKPTIPTVSYPVSSVNTKTGSVVLTNADVGAAATVHTHAIGDVTNLQTILDSKANSSTLANYVTTSSLSTTLGGYASTTALATGLADKFNAPTGSTTQYIRGNGTLATFPSIPVVPTNVSSFTNDSGYLTATSVATLGLRRVETFLGTSDASGNITITFANTYATPPDIQPQIIGGTFNQSVRVVSVSTTGCVVQAAQRNVVTLLGLEVLLGATVALAGASVSIQVTSRS